MRGHCTVALHDCKDAVNVGGAFRAAGCYGADLVVLGGRRHLQKVSRMAADTQKIWKHTPVLQGDDVFKAMPHGAIPIAIDLVPGAIDLCAFQHPERAFYVFGPEDGTLGKTITERCKYKVMVPTRYCMNLAAAVNVVLYDRLMKQALKRRAAT